MTVDINTLVDSGNDGNTDQTRNWVPISSLNIYTFMDYAYEGSGIYRDGTALVPHDREMDYDKRREIASYKNYLKPIVRAMIEPVFTEEAIREVTTDDGTEIEKNMFTEFLKDVDNDGTKMQAFTEQAIRIVRVHGCAFVIMDNFPADEQPKSVNEAIEKRIYPYVYVRKANQVAGYSIDKFGALVSITFQETDETVDGKTEHRYRKWNDTESQVLKKSDDGNFENVGEPIPHGLGEIPVILIYSVRRTDKDSIYVDPPLYDIARLNHVIYNKDSEIREIERAQGFSILYVQNVAPGDITIGTSNYINIPEGATIPPGFASPDPSIQAQLMKYGTELREDLFRIAEQSGVTGTLDQSGIAKQWDFFAHESVLKKTSAMATEFEDTVAEFYKRYTKEVFNYNVDYKSDFQPNNVIGEVEVMDKYLLLQPGSKGKALALEVTARNVFRDQDPKRVLEVTDQEKVRGEEQAESEEEQAKIAAENAAKMAVIPPVVTGDEADE